MDVYHVAESLFPQTDSQAALWSGRTKPPTPLAPQNPRSMSSPDIGSVRIPASRSLVQKRGVNNRQLLFPESHPPYDPMDTCLFLSLLYHSPGS